MARADSSSLIAVLTCFALAASGPAQGAPDYSDSVDFVREIDLGYSAAGGRITAPFNVSMDATGVTELRYIEINSTNLVPVTIRVYDGDTYSDFNQSQNAGRELIAAENVTYFLWDIVHVSLETVPAANHTSLDEMRAHFADLERPAEDGPYFVVVDNLKFESAQVLYRQDREGKDLLGRGLGAPLLVAAVGLPIAALAIVLFLRSGRAPREKGGGGSPPPGGSP